MKPIEINRDSITCIGVILIVAIITCGIFGIFPLIESVRNKNIQPENSEPASINEASTPTISTSEVNSLCPSWTKTRNDISGNRNDVWELLYENEPSTQISWTEFKDQVIVCNPTIIQDGYVFIKGKTYVLP